MQQVSTALALNTGSSSLKFSCYQFTASEPNGILIYTGTLSRIGQTNGKFQVFDGNKNCLVPARQLPLADINAACTCMFEWIKTQPAKFSPIVIGHRIVHGGAHFSTPQVINADIIESLESLRVYAPEHLPPALKAISIARQLFPDTPHVACFDTAFHTTIPPIARTYPIPKEYRDHGLQKYGFHGLSYQYLMSELFRQAADPTEVTSKKIILAHLGHGASMAAVKHGQCVETTMGFSPTGGFPMSSRCGDLDPEVVLFLLQHENIPIDEMKDVLNKRSGLAAFTNTGDDMRDLLDAEAKGDEMAIFAVDFFVYHLTKHIGALVSSLNGLDLLVFSAGIGENCHVIRKRVCDRLQYLGVEIDDAKNDINSSVISSASSRVTVRVVPTNEEVIIARQSVQVVTVSAESAKAV